MTKQKRVREQISLRIDTRITDYYTGLAKEHQQSWGKKVGTPPTRNWFMERQLAVGAGIEEAADWKEGDVE